MTEKWQETSKALHPVWVTGVNNCLQDWARMNMTTEQSILLIGRFRICEVAYLLKSTFNFKIGICIAFVDTYRGGNTGSSHLRLNKVMFCFLIQSRPENGASRGQCSRECKKLTSGDGWTGFESQMLNMHSWMG